MIITNNETGSRRMPIVIHLLYMAGATCFFVATAMSLWQELNK